MYALLIIIVVSLALLLGIFLLNFYRDPRREIPFGKNSIVSPADGKVISIVKISKFGKSKIDKGMFGKIKTLTKDVAEECYAISIFMSPLNVHVNRSPIKGTVKSIRHTPGKFFMAYDLKKSLENEKNEIIIENAHLKIKVIQIAGFLARRIHCYAHINQKLNKGQKIGMISLGSQATIIIPKTVNLIIKLHDKVKAGETVIADLN